MKIHNSQAGLVAAGERNIAHSLKSLLGALDLYWKSPGWWWTRRRWWLARVTIFTVRSHLVTGHLYWKSPGWWLVQEESLIKLLCIELRALPHQDLVFQDLLHFHIRIIASQLVSKEDENRRYFVCTQYLGKLLLLNLRHSISKLLFWKITFRVFM